MLGRNEYQMVKPLEARKLVLALKVLMVEF